MTSFRCREQRLRITVVLAVACAAISWSFSIVADAGLVGPPDSFVVPVDDGKHILVMLAPTPRGEDEGILATLPNGKQVDVKRTYPASGLYEIGKTKPIWTIPWHEDVWISKDGRYLVAFNPYGDGYFVRGGTLEWGIRFYENGSETESYGVAELIDYPSLMEWTSAGYHSLWIDCNDDNNPNVQDGILTIRTSTHATFQFDIVTGAMLSEFRLWRNVSRIAKTVIAIFAVGIGLSIVRTRRKMRRRSTLPAKKILQNSEKPKVFAYSLRSLLIAITVVAMLFGIGRIAPHVAIFLASVSVSVALTIFAVRLWRVVQRIDAGRMKWLGVFVVLAAICCWFVSYFLSFGPTLALMKVLDAPNDVRWAVYQTVYAPVWWLELNGSLREFELINQYFRAWR